MNWITLFTPAQKCSNLCFLVHTPRSFLSTTYKWRNIKIHAFSPKYSKTENAFHQQQLNVKKPHFLTIRNLHEWYGEHSTLRCVLLKFDIKIIMPAALAPTVAMIIFWFIVLHTAHIFMRKICICMNYVGLAFGEEGNRKRCSHYSFCVPAPFEHSNHMNSHPFSLEWWKCKNLFNHNNTLCAWMKESDS